MFDWFRKRSRPEAEIVTELTRQTAECTDAIRAKWTHFNQTLKSKDSVPLYEVIEAFADPVSVFVQENYPLLMSSQRSGTHFWMMILTAVLESGTHPKESVNAAADELRKKYAS
jgi:hypothetical protein